MTNNSISILNVGHGNSTVINCNNKYSIVDAGPKSTVLGFLKSHSIEDIEYLFLSHSDKDHIEGTITLLADKNVKIQKILLNSDSLKESVLWKDLLYVIEDHYRNKKIKPDLGIFEGTSYSLDNAIFKIISPSFSIAAAGVGAKSESGKKIVSNSVSLCIVLEHSGKNIICLPGDLDELGYSHVPEDLKKELACDYLVFPHHGGKCKGNYLKYYSDLLDDVNPSTIIFSNGRGGSPNPRQDVVDLIRTNKPEATIMCTQLSEQCSANIPDENNNYFEHLESRRCAGNISILCDSENNVVQPDLDVFNKFKESLPTPQCQ